MDVWKELEPSYRKDDLEKLIRESYAIILAHETSLQTYRTPEEQKYSERKIQEHWEYIKKYFQDYFLICDTLAQSAAEDILQVAVHFPVYGSQVTRYAAQLKAVVHKVSDVPTSLLSVVTEWLAAFQKQVHENSFETVTAECENDAKREQYLVEHPLYKRLLEPSSVAVFSNVGCGKTTWRLKAKRSLEDENRVLVIEYLDWPSILIAKEIPLSAHIQNLTNLIAKKLDISPAYIAPVKPSCRSWLINLAEFSSEFGYESVCVQVDQISNNLVFQQDPLCATDLVKSLIMAFDLFVEAKICLQLFLPQELEPILCALGSWPPNLDRVHLQYTTDQIKEMLNRRLSEIFSSQSDASLRMFLQDGWRFDPLADIPNYPQRRGTVPLETVYDPLADLDAMLIDRADGSPRRLIRMVNALFHHRAQKWKDSGQEFEKLHIQSDDLVWLLEKLRDGVF